MLDQIDKTAPATPLEAGDSLPYPRSVVFGVSVFLLAVAVLLVWQMKTRFQISLPDLSDSSQKTFQQLTNNLLEEQDAQLKVQDSDGDGLSDYDELKVYGTSPFIADTDSDGLKDGAEVKAGTDPNCPQGKTCFGGQQTGEQTDSTQNNPFYSTDFKAVLGDPQQLRALLIQGGADPRLVNAMDDQTVQALAQEAFKDSTQATPEKIQTLQKLTPDQIRNLLKSSGMSDEQLSQFTDEQLQQIYDEALNQAAQEINSNPQ
jgi:hypothetical protein